MKLKVKLNKNIAFSNYLRHVINLERWPWTKRGPLKRIPLVLSKKATEFSSPIRFSYENHPLKDFDGYSKEFRKIIREVEKLHNEEWRKHQEKLKTTARVLREIVKEYGTFIAKTISDLTRYKWPYSEVWLIPSVYSGGTVVDNKVFIGCDEGSKEGFISLVIHELIHVNEPDRNKREKKLEKELKLPTDSREISTVILTNKIIDKLNNKFNLKISHQNFHIYYREFIRKWTLELEEVSKNKNLFNSLVKAVDEFLVKKGYKGYYSRYIK